MRFNFFIEGQQQIDRLAIIKAIVCEQRDGNVVISDGFAAACAACIGVAGSVIASDGVKVWLKHFSMSEIVEQLTIFTAMQYAKNGGNKSTFVHENARDFAKLRFCKFTKGKIEKAKNDHAFLDKYEKHYVSFFAKLDKSKIPAELLSIHSDKNAGFQYEMYDDLVQ